MNYFQNKLKIILESSEDQYLNLISQSPDDWGLKLEFADWLEERGDPLSQAIKISYEIVNTPNVPEIQSYWQIQSQAQQRQEQRESGSIYWDIARQADIMEEYLDNHQLPQLLEELSEHLYKYKIKEKMKIITNNGLGAKIIAIDKAIGTLQSSQDDDMWYPLSQSSIPNVKETAELFQATMSKLFKISRNIGSIANSIWGYHP